MQRKKTKKVRAEKTMIEFLQTKTLENINENRCLNKSTSSRKNKSLVGNG